MPPVDATRYVYPAKVVRVIDGDTVDCDVDLGFHTTVRERFRLYGINAWEVTGEEKPRGIVARQALEKLLADSNNEIIIHTIEDKKGKYGRYLAILIAGELDVNSWLVKSGHAIEQQY